LFWPTKTPSRDEGLQQPEERHGEKTVQGGFGHLVENLAVEQFGLLGNQAHFAQRMICLHGERQDLRVADLCFRFFDFRHARNLAHCGGFTQARCYGVLWSSLPATCSRKSSCFG